MFVDDVADYGEFSVGGDVEEESIVGLEGDAGEEPGTEGIAEDGEVGGLEELSGEGLDGEVADFVDVGSFDYGTTAGEGASPPGREFEVALAGSKGDEGILPGAEDVVAGIELVGVELDFAKGNVERCEGVGSHDVLNLGGACSVHFGEVDGLADVATAGEIGVGGETTEEIESGLGVEVGIRLVDVEHDGIAGNEGGNTEFDLGHVNPEEVASREPGAEEFLDGGREGLGTWFGAGDAALDGAPAALFFGGGTGTAVRDWVPGWVGVGEVTTDIGTPFVAVSEEGFGEGGIGFVKFGLGYHEVEDGVVREGFDIGEVVLFEGDVLALVGELDAWIVNEVSEVIENEFAFGLVGTGTRKDNAMLGEGLVGEFF